MLSEDSDSYRSDSDYTGVDDDLTNASEDENGNKKPPEEYLPGIEKILDDGRIDVKSERPLKVVKRIIKEGTGPKPRRRTKCSVVFTGKLQDGTIVDSVQDREHPFLFKLGIGQAIKGWDVGVGSMRVGEIAELTIASDYAYGKNGKEDHNIPPDSPMIFEIELLDVEDEPETDQERYDFALKKKELGNKLSKEGNWKSARDEYETGLCYIDYLKPKDEELKQPLLEARIALHLNKCLCYLKMEKPHLKRAKEEAEEVLKLDSSNAKALFRRSLVYRRKGDLKMARADLESALKSAPKDNSIRSELESVIKQQANIAAKQKKVYAGLFEKLRSMEENEEKSGTISSSKKVEREKTTEEKAYIKDISQSLQQTENLCSKEFDEGKTSSSSTDNEKELDDSNKTKETSISNLSTKSEDS
ncbi:putative peptidyl-prolyl cis-trans isomerase [Monocercomonoides exilis]|uniref:putative peptidyl-prolyl cis-trans isomerase n=1 Tax=Monocercomonoides exilis TaxID=2049356 RepID=UPI0035593B04|nr:putative peptidyl-prolyl cis-trans isomerase [Monocercomonoides exilis]|eukprot:MONOS_2381.1-p1 / transcript=MONOS_2381.1 / gene=MONOS_2381 / organism=Monocercomonoides_exilis_PA203 / gene_product=peptidyl-prolyl cis-trans isomerase, putative / transcript_product=peptidyl-prolyl cis-trans isomerase, putative / location=Mono_scaffold00049:29292-30542(-) / protein_length=416 / sequence_SO=supercontig / SO=protein_coding / is_pseudo=false